MVLPEEQLLYEPRSDGMCYLPAWLFPLLTTLYLPVACLITYGMAVSNDHVRVNFPFISDMGIHSPESFVFAIFLNFYSVLVTFTVYLRYRQTQATLSAPRERCIRHTNVLALILGLVLCGGLIVVANVPSRTDKSQDKSKETSCQAGNGNEEIISTLKYLSENGDVASYGTQEFSSDTFYPQTRRGIGNPENVMKPMVFDECFFGHVVGAFVTFTSGMFYTWVQTGLGYKMTEIPYSYAIIRHFRVALCLTQAFLIIFFTVKVYRWFMGVAPEDYVPATSSEWALAFSLSLFFATYILEFRQLRCTSVVTITSMAVHMKSADGLPITNDQNKLQDSDDVDGHVNEHRSQLLELENQP